MGKVGVVRGSSGGGGGRKEWGVRGRSGSGVRGRGEDGGERKEWGGAWEGRGW